MRKVKQVSIAEYIANRFMILFVAIMFVMLVAINFLVNVLCKYDIRVELSSELRRNSRNFAIREEELLLKDSFITEEDGIYYQIVSGEGILLAGKYPEGFYKELPLGHGLRQVKCGDKTYYVQEREKRYGKMYLRCVVDKSIMSSEYLRIKYVFSILGGIFILVVAVFRGIFIRQLIKPINEMKEKSEEIGRKRDLSYRIEYDGIFRELTTLSEANNRMLDQIEKMFETQKQFTSDVAHELRTPVTVLMAQCDYTKRHLNEPDEVEEGLSVIRNQAKKMNNIVIQMLNLSRLDQDRMQMSLEYIDLAEIVESICDEMGGEEVTFDISLPELMVYADVCLMTMLIQNLVSNAVKYSPARSVVKVYAEQKEDVIELSIQDFGYGIDKENLENIFKRFYRVEKTGEVEGFGLGLPLARKIAEKHGGTIEVTSQLGKGSTFTLVLPTMRKDA